MRALGTGGRHHGRTRGRRRGHLVPEVWERLDDEVPELEQGTDLILQFLQGHQGLGLFADEVVERTGAQGHAVHATDADAAAAAADAVIGTDVYHDTLRRTAAAAAATTAAALL